MIQKSIFMNKNYFDELKGLKCIENKIIVSGPKFSCALSMLIY